MSTYSISFNVPYLCGTEFEFIREAISSGKISGNGMFTNRCQTFFQDRYGFNKCLLTTSCTDALEMAALLLEIKSGDEVIMPSFTFVSTANAFVLRGAKIVFVDSRSDHPGMDESKIEELITTKTKAIVVVHYAGVACDMDVIMDIADRHGLFVVEDAAQSIDSYYKGKPLGSIGHLAAFSFHETKNIQCGEGGMLVVNDAQFEKRSEIIWEKGTNRSAFFRGEIDKYSWVDVGSSFLPSEITAAFLWAQLENLEKIQEKRLQIWRAYQQILSNTPKLLELPVIPEYATNNAHIYYLKFKDRHCRQVIIDQLKEKGVQSVFHYLSLHKSKFFQEKNPRFSGQLAHSDHYSEGLLRLPLYYQLKEKDVRDIAEIIIRTQE